MPPARRVPVINAIAEVGASEPHVLERAREQKAALLAYVVELVTEAGIPKPADVSEQVVLLMDGAMVSAQRDQGPGAGAAAQLLVQAVLRPNSSRAGRRSAPRRAR